MSARGLMQERLSSATDSEDSCEEVDDVYVQCCGTANGVVHGLWDAIGTSPVIADVATEDEDDGPVDDSILSMKDEDFNQPNANHNE